MNRPKGYVIRISIITLSLIAELSTDLAMATRVARCRLAIWETILAKDGIVACFIGALKPRVDGGRHEYLPDTDESV